MGMHNPNNTLFSLALGRIMIDVFIFDRLVDSEEDLRCNVTALTAHTQSLKCFPMSHLIRLVFSMRRGDSAFDFWVSSLTRCHHVATDVYELALVEPGLS